MPNPGDVFGLGAGFGGQGGMGGNAFQTAHIGEPGFQLTTDWSKMKSNSGANSPQQVSQPPQGNFGGGGMYGVLGSGGAPFNPPPAPSGIGAPSMPHFDQGGLATPQTVNDPAGRDYNAQEQRLNALLAARQRAQTGR